MQVAKVNFNAPELFRLEDGLKLRAMNVLQKKGEAPELFRLEDGLKQAGVLVGADVVIGS